MTVIRGLAFIGLCLGLQAGLSRLVPAAMRYVDFMVVPVLWYAIVRSQRSAMLAGCASGLLQDAWFQVGVFGMSGFIKTFLGWVVGGLGSRFDLNAQANRIVAGVLFSLAQSVLELSLRRLLDQVTGPAQPLEWIIRAGVTGLLVAVGFPIMERVAGGPRAIRALRRSY